MDANARYEELLDRHLPTSQREAVEFLGELINLSSDLGMEEGLCRAIELSREIESRNKKSSHMAFLHFFRANAFSSLRKIRHAESHGSLQWEIPETAEEILNLRKALQLTKGKQSLVRLRCQVLTNLGNALDFIGRFAESIQYYNRALALEPKFSMAVGNRGYATFFYGTALYDAGQKILFFRKAHADLVAAVSGDLEPGAGAFFDHLATNIAAKLGEKNLGRPFDFQHSSLGASSAESTYREWCLRETLFLNPLNDLFSESTVANDILHIPPVVVPIGDGMYYQGMFNQLKQEYASARYLLHEALHAREPHYSDRDVQMINTLDYPCYGISSEKLRIAFRLAHSTLDKIAYFVNRYFEAGEDNKRVYFQSLWYVDRDHRKGLKTVFSDIQNWPLRGLFWLSKDLAGAHEWEGCLEPEAQSIATIRNHLEHKYLVIHDMMYSSKNAEADGTPFRVLDPLVAHFSRTEIEAKTMKLLKLARAALVYLSLSIHWEEKVRNKKRDQRKVFPGIPMDMYEDNWKR